MALLYDVIDSAGLQNFVQKFFPGTNEFVNVEASPSSELGKKSNLWQGNKQLCEAIVVVRLPTEAAAKSGVG